MIYSTLGTTKLHISRIGLGLAAAGRPGYINVGHAQDLEADYDVEVMRERAEALLEAAWAAGVRYFDTARSYGRAETFLGGWLRERAIAPADIAVGSKWGYTYTANWQTQAADHEIKNHSFSTLQRQWHETQAELGAYLDLYQIHSATLESGVLDDRAVLHALAQHKANGMLVGLSLSGPQQAETLCKALEIAFDGVRLFDSVQATWNLLEQTAGAVLVEAHAAGMGVIVKEALANGRLTTRNSDPSFVRQRTLLEQHAIRLGTTVDALALSAVLAQPWADVVLSGAATVATLQSNLHALHVPWDEEAAAVLMRLAEDAQTYWATRKQLPWN